MARTIYSDPPSKPKIGKVHESRPVTGMMKTWELRRTSDVCGKRASVVDELVARVKARHEKATA